MGEVVSFPRPPPPRAVPHFTPAELVEKLKVQADIFVVEPDLRQAERLVGLATIPNHGLRYRSAARSAAQR
jgi:hypothetical protein